MPTDPNDLYIVTWCHGDESTQNAVVNGVDSTLVTGLEPGQECVVTVAINNVCVTGEAMQVNVTTPTGKCGKHNVM